MKLIIDIPDKDYEHCKMLAETIGEVLIHHSPSDRIKYFVGVGTPLPKGHGRLIDAEYLKQDMIRYGWHHVDCTVSEYVEDMLPTIIEAESDDIEAMLEHLWNATVEDMSHD